MERLLGSCPQAGVGLRVSARAHRLGLDQRQQTGCWFKNHFPKPNPGRSWMCFSLQHRWVSRDRRWVAFTSAVPGAAAGSGFPCFYTETIHPLNFPQATADSFISGRDIPPSRGQVLPLGLSSILRSSLKALQAWGPPNNTAANSAVALSRGCGAVRRYCCVTVQSG